MTAEDFREMALGFPGAIEGAHMNHPDFRANNRIFATLQYPGEDFAMVKLPPDQQMSFIESDPAFTPVKGAWGRQGATQVRLKSAREETVRGALAIAWGHTSQKKSRRK